jgi:hypothetical protein
MGAALVALQSEDCVQVVGHADCEGFRHRPGAATFGSRARAVVQQTSPLATSHPISEMQEAGQSLGAVQRGVR